MAINKSTSGAIYGRVTATTMVAEPVTSSAGNIYQITSSLHQVIDPAAALSLNATASTFLDTTYFDKGWNYFTGQFKLTTATSPTVTGSWVTLTSLAYITQWSLTAGKNAQEITAIGDAWKAFWPIENGVTLTLKRFYADTNFWTWVTAGNDLIFKIWENATNGFWLKGIVKTFGPGFSVGKVDDESISIIADGPISYF